MATTSSDPSHAVFQPNNPTAALAQPHPPSLATALAPNHTLEAFKDIIFGSTAGILGKFVEYPFDTIKVRLQAQAPAIPIANPTSLTPPSSPQGPLDAFVAAWRSPEGPLRNLYRGISAPIVGAAVETSALFFSYRVAQNLLVEYVPSLSGVERDRETGRLNLPFSALLVAGAASGTFTSFLLTPIELIKCRMQVRSSSVPIAGQGTQGAAAASLAKITPVQLIRQVFSTQGILGFWHGQLGTLIRETGGSAAWFGSYEGVKLLFRRYNASRRSPTNPQLNPSDPPQTPALPPLSPISLPQQLLAGALAGVSYNFFFYPADTIKSRMQTEDAAAINQHRTTFAQSTRQLWRQQGVRGFYRGCAITVFRAAPSSAIIFGIYEGLRGAFG